MKQTKGWKNFLTIRHLVAGAFILIQEGAYGQQNVLEMEDKAKNKLFTGAKLKCLVCKNMIDEFEYAFSQTNPNKVIDVGSKRMLPNGDTDKKLVKYLRSKAQLDDLVDTICSEQMADYAQARWKESKEATIIRIVRHDGGMNPLMAMADMVPDDQLNTRLQYYCESIISEEEDHVLAVFADEKSSREDKMEDLCTKRTGICKDVNKKSKTKKDKAEL